MPRIHTKHICTITELREPQKVPARANGQPVAVMKNSGCVACLVPEEASLQEESRTATMADVQDYIARSRDNTQPILDYLKDK